MDKSKKDYELVALLDAFLDCVKPETSEIVETKSEQSQQERNTAENTNVLIDDIAIDNRNSDDELYMWVESPVIVDLVSSDDENNSVQNIQQPAFDARYVKSNNQQRNGYQEKKLSNASDRERSIMVTNAEADENKLGTETTRDIPPESIDPVASPDYSTTSPIASPTLLRSITANQIEGIVRDQSIHTISSPHPTRYPPDAQQPALHSDLTGYNPADKHEIRKTHFDTLDRKNRFKISKEQSQSSYNREMNFCNIFNRRNDRRQFNNYSHGGSSTSQRNEQLKHKQKQNNTNDPSQQLRMRSRSPIKDNLSLMHNYGTEEHEISIRRHRSGGASNFNNEQKHQMNERRDETTLFISKKDCRFLSATENGYQFLNNAFYKHGVKLRMVWGRYSNRLVINGTPANQAHFHDELNKFIDGANASIGQEFCLPSNKMLLIAKIKEQLDLLEQPLGNINELYNAMIQNENSRTNRSIKTTNRLRKNLNMILMGQTGLKDGKMHLNALKRYYESLLQQDFSVCPKHFLSEIEHHFNYIFSSYQRNDYRTLVALYNKLPSKLFTKSKLVVK